MISDIGLYLNWNPAPDDANEETIKDWNAKFEDTTRGTNIIDIAVSPQSGS
jgi:hypothetical protein